MITKIKKNQQVMVPIHIKITEEMRDLLTQVAKNHGFPRIQGLIRLYIRRGLDPRMLDTHSPKTAVLSKSLSVKGCPMR